MVQRRSLVAGAVLGGLAGRVFSLGNQVPIKIGLTPVILAEQAAFLARWGRYLSPLVGRPVVFVARDSYQEVLDLLFARQLDSAWICGYPYVQHQRRLSLVAAPTYQGKPLYRSYLIRAKTAKPTVYTWSDLRGRVLAYADPLSNSGWLVAQAQLLAAGVDGRELKKTFFAHSHRNVAEAVASRLAHAGCMDGYVWDTMVQQGMPVAAATEVIWQSEQFGFPPLVALKDAVSEVHGQLFEALAHMPSNEEGRALLGALNLDGFTRVGEDLYSSIQVLARTHSWRGGQAQ